MTKSVAAALGVLAVVFATPAGAQNFAEHAVKIIVPYPADTVARVTAGSVRRRRMPF